MLTSLIFLLTICQRLGSLSRKSSMSKSFCCNFKRECVFKLQIFSVFCSGIITPQISAKYKVTEFPTHHPITVEGVGCRRLSKRINVAKLLANIFRPPVRKYVPVPVLLNFVITFTARKFLLEMGGKLIYELKSVFQCIHNNFLDRKCYF
jgi:hypothetical protein